MRVELRGSGTKNFKSFSVDSESIQEVSEAVVEQLSKIKIGIEVTPLDKPKVLRVIVIDDDNKSVCKTLYWLSAIEAYNYLQHNF